MLKNNEFLYSICKSYGTSVKRLSFLYDNTLGMCNCVNKNILYKKHIDFISKQIGQDLSYLINQKERDENRKYRQNSRKGNKT